jgi:endo-1,4-beta-xylanase
MQGKAGGLDWTIWSDDAGSMGSITTYDVPAFKAAWNESGDFLARLGVQWDRSKTYDQLGTITAQFASKRTGNSGSQSGHDYSYIGMYGWSVSPCVEWYIVEDTFKGNPGNPDPANTTLKGTAVIDGETYTFYTRSTTGTGGSTCGANENMWMQFYSVRAKSRACGEISISKHFDAWAEKGMTLGKMDQAQLMVEVGSGTGTIEFSTAKIIVTP